jgi:hypothetical protein
VWILSSPQDLIPGQTDMILGTLGKKPTKSWNNVNNHQNDNDNGNGDPAKNSYF